MLHQATDAMDRVDQIQASIESIISDDTLPDQVQSIEDNVRAANTAHTVESSGKNEETKKTS